MNARMRVTNEAVAAAYAETGNVWEAGKRLGLGGQTVHKRLLKMGVPTSTRWTPDEYDRLGAMVAAGHSISEIAVELGRPYNGVACKISRLDLKVKHRMPARRRWVDRLTAEVCSQHIEDMIRDRTPITRFAQQQGIPLAALTAAFTRHVPERWEAYRSLVSTLPPITCRGCPKEFAPLNTKQVYCSAACRTQYVADQTYFGGKRSQTVGLDEGLCVLCGEPDDGGLSSHHVYGKENDPDNDYLVALCRGCHKAVTFMASRSWTFDEGTWEALIHLCTKRATHGEWGDEPEDQRPEGIYVNVEIRPRWPDRGGQEPTRDIDTGELVYPDGTRTGIYPDGMWVNGELVG